MPLVIDNLAHRYGDVQALRGISVAAAEGKITAVLGPNAAGKSTLLRCIIGAIKPTAGAVMIDGKACHAMSAYHLAQRIAYVPQRSTVAAAFTVREVVELGRYALPLDHARVDAAIERMELREIAQRPYAALSVGQQQRVTLARALAQVGKVNRSTSQQVNNAAADNGGLQTRSPILVLDEPTSGMDLRHVRDVMALLRELADGGATVLLAMHDLAMAAAVADEAWLLDDGRLVAAGGACDVLTVDRLEQVYEVPFKWIDGRLLAC